MHSESNRIGRSFGVALLAVSIAAALGVAHAAGTRGVVEVAFQHPERFTDIGERYRADAAGSHLSALARHLEEGATRRLRPGERLHVVITEIDRAGALEPWHRESYPLRVVRNVHAPRIDLRFRLEDATGEIVAAGERRLRDPFLLAARHGASDPLRYEKALLEDWLERELARP